MNIALVYLAVSLPLLFAVVWAAVALGARSDELTDRLLHAEHEPPSTSMTRHVEQRELPTAS